MTIILGSSSPYRRQILHEMGVSFRVMSPDIDERALRTSNPSVLVRRLAEAKADALATRIGGPALVITADQVVTQNGMIREKPVSREEAAQFLRSFGDAPLETVSAVAVTRLPDGARLWGVEIARLRVATPPDAVIAALLEQGEVLHCAGALRIEDPLMAPYVTLEVGTPDSVMGLPRDLTRRLLETLRGED